MTLENRMRFTDVQRTILDILDTGESCSHIIMHLAVRVVLGCKMSYETTLAELRFLGSEGLLHIEEITGGLLVIVSPLSKHQQEIK